ncbi:hypothetical protein F4810DRAFT_718684 [Camillea tinctor]|nr:hypothetical protein F4810DRAFT_718684 [Camillea tinctor]
MQLAASSPSLSPAVLPTGPNGWVIWDNEAYEFLSKECPDTADPKLWRIGQLNAIHGLFLVTEGIYQVRGLDISNMTIIAPEGFMQEVTSEHIYLGPIMRRRAGLCGRAICGARAALADVYERLGFGAENGTWRNFYLTKAMYLRSGEREPVVNPVMTSLSPALNVEQWLAGMSVRVDSPKAAEEEEKEIVIEIDVTDVREGWTLILSNGVLTCRKRTAYEEAGSAEADLVLVLTKGDLHQVLQGDVDVAGPGAKGNFSVLEKLLVLCSIDITASDK